jgi:hypothetical protein
MAQDFLQAQQWDKRLMMEPVEASVTSTRTRKRKDYRNI